MVWLGAKTIGIACGNADGVKASYYMTSALSGAIRMTSYSISKLKQERSIRHWVTGESLSCFSAISCSSSSLLQIPPPVPPVNAGRANDWMTQPPSAWSTVLTIPDQDGWLSFHQLLERDPRSSAWPIADNLVPEFHSSSSKSPDLDSSMAILSPVWPPKVAEEHLAASRNNCATNSSGGLI